MYETLRNMRKGTKRKGPTADELHVEQLFRYMLDEGGFPYRGGHDRNHYRRAPAARFYSAVVTRQATPGYRL